MILIVISRGVSLYSYHIRGNFEKNGSSKSCKDWIKSVTNFNFEVKFESSLKINSALPTLRVFT